MRCNTTKLGGLGAGTTTKTGVLIDTIWKRTNPHWMGEATRQLDFAILAHPTRTGLETNLVEKIEPLMDSSIDSKTMGHILGYVGALEQRTPFQRTGTTTNHTFHSQRPDSSSFHRQSPAATMRCIASAVQPN